MELTYQPSGDYLLPNLSLANQPNEPLGKYGRMRKAFLKTNRKGEYSTLLLSGNLMEHLTTIDQQAREQINETVRQMAAAEGMNEQMKVADPLLWTRRMNSLRTMAEETVLREMLYT
ncbi:MAG: TnpV protein [Clostridiaceae bacterium]